MKLKKVILFIAMLGATSTIALAQTNTQTEPAVNKDEAFLAKTPAMYIGLTSGINNSGGIIGLRTDLKINKYIMLSGALGIGSWGAKYSVLAYYLTKSNLNPMLGVSKATGFDSIPLTLKVAGNTERTVIMRYKPATLINIGVEKQWISKRGNRFYIDMGYSFSLSSDILYEVKTPGVTLTDESKKALLIVSPGGLILGVGYSFRLF